MLEDPDSPTIPYVEGVTHRTVGVNGVNLHVAEAGEGEPLLMLHGWPQHWYMWRRQIPELARHYRVICPDMRGFGWSDAPRGGYEKERLVDDVAALIRELKLGRVRLIGHDWGGWVGFLLCLRRPELVEAYLALNIIHPFQKVDRRVLQLWRLAYQLVIAAPFAGRWIVEKRAEFIGRLMQAGAAEGTWAEEEMRVFTDVLRQPAHARASVLLYRTFLLRELIPIILGRYRAHRLTARTKVLFGLDDAAISTELLKGYESNSDDMHVELVPDCGHFIAEERPDLMTARALSFFAA